MGFKLTLIANLINAIANVNLKTVITYPLIPIYLLFVVFYAQKESGNLKKLQ